MAVDHRESIGDAASSALTMNGYQCSRCSSSDLALARVVYEGGTTATRSYTESESTHTSGYGQYAGHTSSVYETQSFGQTGLAARCTPPRTPQPGPPLAIMLGTPIGLWVLYAWLHMRWKGDVVDLLLSGAAAYVFVANAVSVWRESAELTSYPSRLAAYNRTCLCLRCGNEMLLSDDWERTQP